MRPLSINTDWSAAHVSDGGHSALLITVRLSRGRWQYQDLHIKFCCIHCRRHRSYDRNRVLEVQDMFANDWGTVQRELLALSGPRPQTLLYPLHCGRQNLESRIRIVQTWVEPKSILQNILMDKTLERLFLLSLIKKRTKNIFQAQRVLATSDWACAPWLQQHSISLFLGHPLVSCICIICSLYQL